MSNRRRPSRPISSETFAWCNTCKAITSRTYWRDGTLDCRQCGTESHA